ncbi:MAG: zinc ribbon domain-containing protein [candidate division WOR-3 bacterium]|nr:MAG: zinc ribbon domain-containing protein [candidate division WOR-3 bacterium]
MPTYEYRCTGCGHRFDVFQRIVDPPVKDCPRCRAKDSVEQIISGGSGLIFRGSGFYETDYRRKPASTDSARPCESSTSDGTAGSSKSASNGD